ncbi:ABC transporter permease [Vaginella massiliensis]|uniref:hypothetical protein n=1 Tax=Vaginella massiliensis TaxID=1816680 RepID=UPI000838AE8B|nr:hypothetical protein [Vaginella massiliensis]
MWWNSKNLIDKLFRKNLSFLRLISFLIFSFIGLFIMLFAMNLYLDLAPKFKDKSNIWKGQYLVINKKISAFQTLSGQQANFDSDELEELKNQDFVKNIGTFQSSQFPVKLQISGIAGIRGFSTDLFLESIPNDFLDVDLASWQWKEGDRTIPIIIPKNYLNLYNFGFASSQGLPQVSESLFKQIPFQIVIGKGEHQQIYLAKIVDFTNKINTILVPDHFLTWANGHFSTKKNLQPSRIIIETVDQANPATLHYLEQQNYDLNRDELKNNEVMFYLKLAFGIVVGIGLIIILASLWLLIINFQLIIERNREKLRDLHFIGYSPKQLISPYMKYAFASLFFTFSLALVAVFLAMKFIHQRLSDLDLDESKHFGVVVAIGFGMLVLLLSFNYLTIRSSIRKSIS